MPVVNRRPRGSLTPDLILAAAEEVAADGFEALSIRAVATRVGAAPMALYNHFPTKDALVVALLDRVLGRVEPGPPTDDWAADLASFARAHRGVLAEHPWAVLPLFSHAAPGPNATRVGEDAFGILRRGGITGEAAVAAFGAIIALNYGWTAFTAARAPGDGLAADLAALPADRFPLTRELAEPLAGYGSERQYELALDIVVAGLSHGQVGGDR